MEVVDNLLISLSTLMVLPCAAARPALLRKPSAKHADLRAAQAKAAADRDVAALVQSVEGTIWKIADHYSRGLSKEDVEDLRAAGRVGAVVAAERYDVSRGASFNTYALSWIRAYVVKEVFFFWGKGRLRGTNGAVRRIFFRQGRARRDLAAAGTKETPEALADAMGVNVSILADVEVAIAANVPQEDLKDVSSDDGGVLAMMCAADESDDVRVAIADLDMRSQFVIVQRFYEDKTLDEVAVRLGVTRERVRQIEKEAIVSLRRSLRRVAKLT